MQTLELKRQHYHEELLAELEHEVAPKADREGFVHADRLDNARLIAENHGVLSQEELDHLRVQTGTSMIESLGAWDSQVKIAFDGEYLISFGEREHVARARAVMAALAMEQFDPNFSFYTARTKAEQLNKHHEIYMMRHQPIGSARIIFSPAEMKRTSHSRRLGMFPDRQMAIMQISVKTSDNEMTLRSTSFDRASLPIVRKHLQRLNMTISGDAEAEDFISLVKETTFDNQQQLDDFVESVVTYHDALILEEQKVKTFQGVTTADKRGLRTSLSELLGSEAGTIAVNSKIKLDEIIASHILQTKPLELNLRNFVQLSVHKLRADGTPLLSAHDSAKMRLLLAAENVDIQDKIHEGALESLVYVFGSSVEESYRKYQAGDELALDWMKDWINDEMGFSSSVEAVNSGTEAIENGRGAEACGLGSEVGSPSDVSPDAPLWEKYGWDQILIGECIGCGFEGLVGPCYACNLCDANDRRHPGYLMWMAKELQNKKLREADLESLKLQKQELGKKTLLALAA